MRQSIQRQGCGTSGLGVRAMALALVLTSAAAPLRAEIDGHGPDAWRVTGVEPSDRLNARMGPGVSFRVIESFAHDERGMIQVTCVPYLTAGIYESLSEAERKALPARWCLMRSSDLTKAGWVAQRFITPDEGAAQPQDQTRLREAEDLVQALYAAQEQSERGKAEDPLMLPASSRFFTGAFVQYLEKSELGAHPLNGAQDFEGALTLIAHDPKAEVEGENIVVVADFVNFGQPQKAVFTLAPDPSQPGHPIRIAHIGHEGWALPE